MRYRSAAADRDGRADRAGRRRAARPPIGPAVPAHRRGLRRPDDRRPRCASGSIRRPASGGTAPRSDRRSPFGESGRHDGPCYPRPPGRPSDPTQRPGAHPPADGRRRSRRTRTTRGSRHARGAPPRPKAPLPYLNRELSWLEFNARVLHEARDERNPLLERVKFLAIFAGNLDEFFQVRIAGLRQQVEAGSVARSPDGRTADEQLAAARARVLELVAEHSAIFRRRPPRARRGGRRARRLRRRSPSTTRRSASASSTRSSRS